VREPHCNLFFAPESPKSWEIRSFAPPKTLASGDVVWILRSGTGSRDAPVVGRVTFDHALQLDNGGDVDMTEFHSKYEYHRVTNSDLLEFRSKWKSNALWAWVFKDPSEQGPVSLAVRKTTQEVWVNISPGMWVEPVADGQSKLQFGRPSASDEPPSPAPTAEPGSNAATESAPAPTTSASSPVGQASSATAACPSTPTSPASTCPLPAEPAPVRPEPSAASAPAPPTPATPMTIHVWWLASFSCSINQHSCLLAPVAPSLLPP
jgi:hypothetical protein